MSETYSVVMTGEIAEGVALEQAKANVGSLFKLGDGQLQKLFSGKPVAVRRGITRPQADKICKALSKAGVIAKVTSSRPVTAKVAATHPASVSKATGTSGSNRVDKAAASGKVVVRPVPEVSKPDLDCPRCGHHQTFATVCSLCKMDLTLHIQRVEKKALARANRLRAAASR